MTAGLATPWRWARSSTRPPRLAGQMVALIAKERPPVRPGRLEFLLQQRRLHPARRRRPAGSASESYDDYVRQHIFKPAGMSSHRRTPSTSPARSRVWPMATCWSARTANRCPITDRHLLTPRPTLADNANLVQIANPSGRRLLHRRRPAQVRRRRCCDRQATQPRP